MIISDEELNRPHIWADLNERTDYLLGRQDSMHGVEFADMLVSDGSLVEYTQPVAIKPLDEAWLAVREYRTANSLNSISPNATFNNVGFMRIDDKFATLTRFEQGVTSFDNILWKEKKPTTNEVEWALSCAAASLIFLHANQYVHGDFQVKNTAYGTDMTSRIIDVTTTKKQADPMMFMDDIYLYTESLGRFGTQASHTSEDEVHEFLLEPYRDAIDDIFPKSKSRLAKERLGEISFNLTHIIKGR